MKENENGLAYIQMLYNIFHRIIELVKEWFDLFLQEYFCYCKYYNHDISVMKLDYCVSTIIVQPNIFLLVSIDFEHSKEIGCRIK